MHDDSRRKLVQAIELASCQFVRISESFRSKSSQALHRLISQSAFLLAVFLSAQSITAVESQVLHGHVPKVASDSPFLAHLGQSQRLNLAIGLPVRNKPALIKFITDIYDPASPRFRQYLSTEQFSAMFGPTERDYSLLVHFAETNGLTVTARHPNRLILDVNGAVKDIEKTFHVRMELYQHPSEPRTFFAPDVEPSLDLEVPVQFVGGLNNRELPRPKSRQFSANARSNNGSAPNGDYMGQDFRNAYAPGLSLNGAGQAVALVQFDGFYSNDIIAYEALAGLSNVPLQTILLDGYDGVPSIPSGNVEVSLDIETVISMAPGLSKVILYEAGAGGLPEDILSRIANDNLANQISCSWTWQPYDPNSEATFLQFAAQGQTFFNATGDHDAFVGPITESPSDEPYATQVGGTALTMDDSGGTYLSEIVWNRGSGIGSAGGISTTYAIPFWQQAVDMSANAGSTSMRNVPDVAMVAENVYVKYGSGSSGSFGGTSCSAPLWAAFNALMNQQAVAAGRPSVGFLNPAIYRIGTNSDYASCFHDITVGDNTSANSPTLFHAVAGYDLCTGWGTPNGSNFINAVVGPPVFAPLIVADGISLTMETCPNGVVDPGETVTMSLGLKNLGLIRTTNLVAILQSTGGVIAPSGPQSYGALTSGDTVTRPFTFIATGVCGATNSVILYLQDGSSNLGSVTFSLPLGRRRIAPILAENFDQVTAPGLPVGWTVSLTGSGPPWSTTGAVSGSPPNSAFAGDPASSSDNRLTSPLFFVAGTSTQLSFRHNYYTETVYDGGVLEISIGGGPFTDILAAGGSFTSNGYVQPISTCCGNPLGGRSAWTGNSGGFITTVANLPVSASGRTVQLRWRFCSDSVFGATGWYIDDVSVLDGFACCTAIQPMIQSIIPTNDEVSITWNSVSNRNYRLQSNTNLTESNWTDVSGDVNAIGYSATKTDVMDQVMKFYRVVLLP